MRYYSRLLGVLVLFMCLAACGTYPIVPRASGRPPAVLMIAWIDQCTAHGLSILTNVAVRLDRAPAFDLSQGTGVEELAFTLIPKPDVRMPPDDKAIIERFNEILGVRRVGGRLVLERSDWVTEMLVNSELGIGLVRGRLPAFIGWRFFPDEQRLESNDFTVVFKVGERLHPRSYSTIPKLEPYPGPMLLAELKSLGKDTFHTPATLSSAKLRIVYDTERSAAKAVSLVGTVRFVPIWVEFVDVNTALPLGCLPVL